MKNLSSLKFIFPSISLLISLQMSGIPDPTGNKIFKDRGQFESTVAWKKLSENFDSYHAGDRIHSLFDSLVTFATPPMAFPGAWNEYQTGGSFAALGLLPLPCFQSSSLTFHFSEPVYGVGANVFDDFDGTEFYNKITLTVETANGEFISTCEDSTNVGDCGFLGAISADGIVSAIISIDGSDANLELDLFSVLLAEPCSDADGDGICDNYDSCPSTPNNDQADADCDGVGNVCDRCSGGNDGKDTDGDGTPDCADWDGINKLPSSWRCGSNNSKVVVCHNGNSLCVSTSAVPAKLQQGDFLGPCNESLCNSALIGGSGATELFILETVVPEAPDLDVYPNPSQGNFSVDFADQPAPDSYFVVTDASGKVVFQQKVLPNQQSYFISTSGFPKGMYLVKVFEDGKETSKQDVILM